MEIIAGNQKQLPEIENSHPKVKNHRSGNLIWLLCTLIIALLLGIPVMAVLYSILLPAGDVWIHLKETVLSDYVTNSLLLVSGVALGTLILGTTTAWLCTVCEFPGRRLLSLVLFLPLAFPPYIIAYTYTGMLDVAGPVQSLIRVTFGWQYGDYWFPQIRSLSGAIVMLSLVLYPYIYILSRTAFAEQPSSLRETGSLLGARLYKTFTTISLPLARPAIIAGLTLVVMETLADYGTVQYFGISTLTTGIFRTWFGFGDRIAATQLACLLLLFVFVVIAFEHYRRQPAKYQNLMLTRNNIRRYPLPRYKAILATVFCGLPVVLGFIIPSLQLASWALQTAPEVVDASFYKLVANTVQLGAIVAAVIAVTATLLAYGKRIGAHPIIPHAVNLTAMGYAVPGIIIAVGVLLPFAWFDNAIDAWLRQHWDISSGLLLTGTLTMLVFAHVVRFMALGLNPIDAGLAKIHSNIDDAAQLLGCRAFTRFTNIHLPIIHSGILVALLLVFVEVIKELPATLVLRPFNFNTLAVRTYELASDERLADSACSALLIVAIGILPIFVLVRSATRTDLIYGPRT